MRDRIRDGGVALRLGWAVDRRLSAALATTIVMTNVAMALRALWFKLLVDAVVVSGAQAAIVWAACLAVSEAARSWSLVQSQMLRQDLHDRAVEHFEVQCMRLAGHIETIAHFERQDFLDRLGVLRSSFSTLASASAAVIDVIATVVRAIVTVALLATITPWLVLLPLFALPTLAAARLAERISQRGNLATIEPNRRADHLYGLLTSGATSKEVRIFGLADVLSEREVEQRRRATAIGRRALVRSSVVNLAGWSVFLAGFCAAILLVLHLVALGEASPGDVFLAVLLSSQINAQVVSGSALVGTLTQSFQAIDHHRWLLGVGKGAADRATRHGLDETPPVGLADDEGGDGAEAPVRLDRGIELHDVSFSYGADDSPTLTGIELAIPAGSVVAVVGENGAGKSTLVKLLLGMYRPSTGSVLVDGRDLSEIDGHCWLSRVAASFQDFVRFELPLQESVGVGDVARCQDADAVLTALDRSSAADIVGELPDGLGTQLGPVFDGVDLSGGQWQRLAIARAMMREAPLLIVLDEPTASLDPDAEFRLFETYSRQARRAAALSGAITVLVSHRFSTVRMADLIVVLDNGSVVEVGTHDELMRHGALYAELFALQADSYA